MNDLPSRIRAYLQACPAAVSGQGGHNQTFTVACALVNGFGLSDGDALGYLREYNSACQPPWTENELGHKIKSASQSTHNKPRGHLVGVNGSGYKPEHFQPHSTPPARAPDPKPKTLYNPKKPTELPIPMDDAARKFLMAAFSAGEAIGISSAILNGEGRCVPTGGGATHSREEWIKKLDAEDGDPNKLFDDQKGLCGAFVRINPLTMGGTKDADVTAFRHALIEFDHCSIEEQWNLITQSKIPCTAVLHSGNKSLHAWVRIDAKDRAQYAQRVKTLYDHFVDYGIDPKNKNPSRFSRLPGMMRGKKRQDLLAIKIGAPSFDQWLIDREADGIGTQIRLKDLLAFVPSEDPNCILGKRWLCRGGSCLWVGQSGIGKSSLALQAAILWALGKPLFGVYPARPLKSLFIQAENDEGDLAEMMQGVVTGLFPTEAEQVGAAKVIDEQIIMITDPTRTGKEFVSAAQRLIEKHKPDLVWVDPLLSFIGDDISSQKVCSQFLRNWLNPISQATGATWMLVHHTNKPEKDPKARKGWTSSDYSYLGTGSAELVNWARAAILLKHHDEHTFKLMFTKRGNRAKATDLRGQFTSNVYLEYSQHGICWDQIEPVEEDETQSKPGRKAKSFDMDGFIASMKGKYFGTSGLETMAVKFSGLGKSTIYEKYMNEIKSRLRFDPSDSTYHGANT